MRRSRRRKAGVSMSSSGDGSGSVMAGLSGSYYSMSLPVTAVVLGMPKLEHVEENIGLAKSFRKMPEGEMRGLSRRLAAAQKASLDGYFAEHRDG
jgi:predicted aldo/keto reductase-like oxidoreductase